MTSCPICGADSQKVIYVGLPMRLCVNGECNGLFGVFASVAGWLPIATDDGEFAFMAYDGWYVIALWRWLRGGDGE